MTDSRTPPDFPQDRQIPRKLKTALDALPEEMRHQFLADHDSLLTWAMAQADGPDEAAQCMFNLATLQAYLVYLETNAVQPQRRRPFDFSFMGRFVGLSRA